MKNIGSVLVALLGLLLAVVAFTRLGMPALLGAGALAIVGVWIWRGMEKDPYVAWGNVRAISIMAVLVAGIWLTVSALSGSLVLAVPLGAAFALSLWGVRYCTRRIEMALPADTTDAMVPSSAHLNTEQANALLDRTISENRRRHVRGTSLHLQAENLELIRQNTFLTQEVQRLKEEVHRLDGALHDPFHDPI
jgi:hypothetical protein